MTQYRHGPVGSEVQKYFFAIFYMAVLNILEKKTFFFTSNILKIGNLPGNSINDVIRDRNKNVFEKKVLKVWECW